MMNILRNEDPPILSPYARCDYDCWTWEYWLRKFIEWMYWFQPASNPLVAVDLALEPEVATKARNEVILSSSWSPWIMINSGTCNVIPWIVLSYSTNIYIWIKIHQPLSKCRSNQFRKSDRIRSNITTTRKADWRETPDQYLYYAFYHLLINENLNIRLLKTWKWDEHWTLKRLK